MAAGKEHYVVLDGMRGIAAIAVVIFHTSNWFGERPQSAYLAVDFFFLLSGFVIAHAFDSRLSSGMRWATFAGIRLIRFYPLYLLGLVTMIFARAQMAEQYPYSWWDFGFGLFFLPNVFVPATLWFIIPAWSLAYELLINGLYAAFHKRLSAAPVLAFVALIGLALLVFVANKYHTLQPGFEVRHVDAAMARVLFSFSLGALIYRLKDRFPIFGPEGRWLAIITLIITVSIMPSSVVRPFYDVAACVLFFPFALVLGARTSTAFKPNVILSSLGTASYAIYVLHLDWFWLWQAALKRIGVHEWTFRPLSGFLALAGLIALCLLLDRIYDRPLRRWLSAKLTDEWASAYARS